jgi:hypothetical protein
MYIDVWLAKFGPGGTHSHRPTAVLGVLVPELKGEVKIIRTLISSNVSIVALPEHDMIRVEYFGDRRGSRYYHYLASGI